MEKVVWCLLLLIVIFPSCRKDRDERAPQLSILSPAEFSVFSVGDLIEIQISASDDQNLEYVRIDLINQNQVRVAGPVEYSNFTGTSDSRTIGLNVTNTQLLSGVYFIRAVAGDGENERSAFREISLNEIPLRIERIFSFRNSSPSSTSVDSLDRSTSTWVNVSSLPIPFGKSEVYSAGSELGFSSGTGGDVEFREAIGLESIQSQSFATGGFGSEYWKDFEFDFDHQRYFLSSADGLIRSFRPGGITDLTFTLPAQYVPHQLGTAGSYLLVEQRPIGVGLSQLGTYFISSGAFLQSAVIQFDLIETIPFTGQRVLLFGNEGSAGKVWLFDIAQNGYSAALDLPVYSSIREAEQGPGNTYFVNDSEGIRKFELSSGGSLSSGGQVQVGNYGSMHFDPVQGVLLALDLDADRIELLSPQNLSILESFPVNSNSVGFEILYNR